MRRMISALSLALMFAGAAVILSAQGPPPTSKGWIHIPASTIERFGDVGVRAHTNHLIYVRSEGKPTKPSGPTGMSPAALWNYYLGGATPVGSEVIAIVDAYHYATALADFNVFAGQFGLPAETSTDAMASDNKVFQVIYATGRQPRANCGWAQEAALDIEWAHAMAPHAKIVLVEAASNSNADLYQAVDVATSFVGVGGAVREVSMSWGSGEFFSETTYDSRFDSTSIVYFASSGDTGGKTIYPSTSPNVVAAGGTRLTIKNGSITGETGWSGSGGGPSLYESRPSFQDGLAGTIGSARGVPDISFDADPSTGVSVYDSTSCQGYVGWMVFGGTSVSSPALAGLTNAAGHFAAGSASQLTKTYGASWSTNFHDIVGGTAGHYTAVLGWDFVTGIGTPKGLGGM